MGYNLTKHSILRNLTQLEQLAQAQASLRFDSLRPERLAANLREAILACAHNQDEYKYLHDALNGRYRFKVEKNHIIAEFVGDVNQAKGKEVKEKSLESRPEGRRLSIPEKKTISMALSLMDVMAAAYRFEEDEELYFPNSILDENDRLALYNWTQEEDNSWQYIDQMDKGLTLTKKEVPDEILWRPD